MKASLGQWFEQQKPRRGLLAGGLRATDNAAVTKVWDARFPAAGVENALRCVADIYQVLQLNGILPGRLRLIYRSEWLHCEMGADGSCLGIFTAGDANGYDAAGLDNLIQEFRVLSGIKPR